MTISKNAVIEDEAVLMPGVSIGEGCRIGKGTVIYANVSIYDLQILKKNVFAFGQ